MRTEAALGQDSEVPNETAGCRRVSKFASPTTTTARRSMLKRSIGLQPGRLCGRLHRRFSSLPAAPKGSRRASFEAIPSSSCRVAIVYGTFASETSAEDAEIMQDYAMRNKLDLLMQVASGDEFDFDSLASCSHLVLSTSSWRGQPPEP